MMTGSEASGVRGRVALMGSGELTPSMVEVHKELLAPLGRDARACFLDTPAGFQPNADQISRKARRYFRRHVGHRLETVSFKSAAEASAHDLQLALQSIGAAAYLLVGPGSPTYMLNQLEDTAIAAALVSLACRGGSLAIASAAALTVGSSTLPVYEIYKVGMELHWRPGLDILGALGLETVVLPHWNNAEGGSHDTRFCYMGEQRFTRLRSLLPEDTRYLGIDEHTACILDFTAGVARVRGQGGVTLVQAQAEEIFVRNSSFPLQLLGAGGGKRGSRLTVPSSGKGAGEHGPAAEGFWPQARQLEAAVNEALGAGDYQAATTGLLLLDRQISLAQSSFESEEDIAQARELFRELLVLLGIELEGLRRRDEVFARAVEGLLRQRLRYKEEERWPEADVLRSILGDAGIVVRDGREGSSWYLRGEDE